MLPSVQEGSLSTNQWSENPGAGQPDRILKEVPQMSRNIRSINGRNPFSRNAHLRELCLHARMPFNVAIAIYEECRIQNQLSTGAGHRWRSQRRKSSQVQP
jgi:hypothetical protein